MDNEVIEEAQPQWNNYFQRELGRSLHEFASIIKFPVCLCLTVI